MAINKHTNGDDIEAGETNEDNAICLRGSSLNTIRQLQDRAVALSADGGEWAEAYIDDDGRLDSVDTALTSGSFDTDKYTTAGFVIVKASSLTESDFNINDCTMIELATGVWQLSATGTYNESIAKIAKTLFYGSNGTDPRATGTYITGVTAITTNISEWISKRGHYSSITRTVSAWPSSAHDVGTFADTSTNNDMMSWSKITTTQAGLEAYWELPNGTTLNSASGGSGDSDELGTDTSGDNISNPADCDLYLNNTGASSGTHTTIVVMVASSTISWAPSGTASRVNTDFNVDNSMPDFTTESTYTGVLITHDVPSGTFSSTIATCFGTGLVEDWEAGADIDYKLTNATEDTGWLNYNEISEFTAFTSEPTKVIVKLIPKSSNPTAGYPSINGFGVREY